MPKTHSVTLTKEQRQSLLDLITTGTTAAHTLAHARILLKADAGEEGPAWTDAAIAEALETSVPTVERVRARFAKEGLEAALRRRIPSRVHTRRLDGAGEAHLIALSCSEPPAGQEHWSLRLLAERMVEMQYVGAISHETVRQALKKTNSSRG
jgi:homeodomain-containing protein